MDAPNPRRRILAAGIAAAVPFVLYGLSLGPVLKIASEQPELRPWLAVYTPIFVVARNVSWANDGLHWYCGEVWNVPNRSQDWGR